MANVLDEIMGRAVRDESFRRSLLADPEAAASGYNLTPGQLEKLRVMMEALEGPDVGKPERKASKFRLF